MKRRDSPSTHSDGRYRRVSRRTLAGTVALLGTSATAAGSPPRLRHRLSNRVDVAVGLPAGASGWDHSAFAIPHQLASSIWPSIHLRSEARGCRERVPSFAHRSSGRAPCPPQRRPSGPCRLTDMAPAPRSAAQALRPSDRLARPAQRDRHLDGVSQASVRSTLRGLAGAARSNRQTGPSEHAIVLLTRSRAPAADMALRYDATRC